jgi:uncharacterized protein (DUF2062 family)
MGQGSGIRGMARRKVSRWKRLGRWLRLQALRMIRENSTPARTGLGFALGTFIGVFPSFLIGTPLAFFLAGRLGWNRAAAMGGTLLMNPLTAPVVYSTSTVVGLRVLGRHLDVAPVSGMLNYIRHFGLAFLVGNTIMAVLIATVAGLLIFALAAYYQRAERLSRISAFAAEADRQDLADATFSTARQSDEPLVFMPPMSHQPAGKGPLPAATVPPSAAPPLAS